MKFAIGDTLYKGDSIRIQDIAQSKILSRWSKNAVWMTRQALVFGKNSIVV